MKVDEAADLAKEIDANRKTGRPVKTTISTDERVLARITDGIYRLPASAIRELISNAYDADATSVVIQTDAPRFAQINVRDNGNGLTSKSLASMLKHIGGSPKRTFAGADLGVTKPNDPNLSPKGRKLIGKIGIGLFSVAQLTRHFQVITKVKGESTRTFADVTLKTHSEEELGKKSKKGRRKFQTGDAKIWSVPAEDIDSHGTEIIILDLRKKTQADLQSLDMWAQVQMQSEDKGTSFRQPSYHIGCVDPKDPNLLKIEPRVPWSSEDQEDVKFLRIVEAMQNEVGLTEQNPRLDTTFDNYFKMLWNLSLAAPIEYISLHPFDLTNKANISFFTIGNDKDSKAIELKLKNRQSVREKLHLVSPEQGGATKFEILFDGIKLFRPIAFKENEQIVDPLRRPLLFFGKYSPNLSLISPDIRGGTLEFEGYLSWNYKVVPQEHRGVLVRINNASGTLFDSTFMNYQISELTRLRQVTAEIFVTKGLDAALNIDRESFNFAHPHFQIISAWVHNALRQFATKHKGIASEIRELRRAEEAQKERDSFKRFVRKELHSAGVEDIPKVTISSGSKESVINRRSDGDEIILDRNIVFRGMADSGKKGSIKGVEEELFEKKIVALAQYLSGLGIFDKMTYSEQNEFLYHVVNILRFSGTMK